MRKAYSYFLDPDAFFKMNFHQPIIGQVFLGHEFTGRPPPFPFQPSHYQTLMLESLRIVAVATLAAMGYGILHDQVTARVCLEFFTVAHPPLIRSTSPTWVALAWGVTATWRFGLTLGIAAAILARLGPWPQLPARKLARPVAGLLVATAISSFLAGSIAYLASELDLLKLDNPAAGVIADERHSRFLATRWAHRVAHTIAILGGSTLCATIWLRRKRAAARLRVGHR